MKRALFAVLLVILGISFFVRNSYRNVSVIAPEVLRQPIQRAVSDPQTTQFTRGGYTVELTPVADYEISALIVGKLDYRLFDIVGNAWIVPVDLSLLQ